MNEEVPKWSGAFSDALTGTMRNKLGEWFGKPGGMLGKLFGGGGCGFLAKLFGGGGSGELLGKIFGGGGLKAAWAGASQGVGTGSLVWVSRWAGPVSRAFSANA